MTAPLTSITFDHDARAKILKGVDVVARAVGATAGPGGRLVLIRRAAGSAATKDGVTVANSVILDDAHEDLGAEALRQAAQRTVEAAGDGTTATCVLAGAIVREGFRLIEAGYSPVALKRGIDLGVAAVVAELKRISRPATDLRAIARISANGDDALATAVADAFEKVGQLGTVHLVRQTSDVPVKLTIVDGFEIARGFQHQGFATDGRAALDAPLVLVCAARLSTMKDVVGVLGVARAAGRSLLVVAQAVEGEALATLVSNHQRGVVRCCAVDAPGLGDDQRARLEDLALAVGATVIDASAGHTPQGITLEHLGAAGAATADAKKTSVLGGNGDAALIAARVAGLRSQDLTARASALAGSTAIISIGGATEAEVRERYDRADDAVRAVRCAIEEGVVVGGGAAFIRCLPVLDGLVVRGDETIGLGILRRALEEPLRQIVANAGASPDVVVAKVKEGLLGYDAARDKYVDLFEAGVIDPVRVTRCSLQNAASVAGLLLSTAVLIAEVPRN